METISGNLVCHFSFVINDAIVVIALFKINEYSCQSLFWYVSEYRLSGFSGDLRGDAKLYEAN